MKKTRRANGDGSIWTENRNGRTYYRAAVVTDYDFDGKPIRKSVGSYNRNDVVKKTKRNSGSCRQKPSN